MVDHGQPRCEMLWLTMEHGKSLVNLTLLCMLWPQYSLLWPWSTRFVRGICKMFAGGLYWAAWLDIVVLFEVSSSPWGLQGFLDLSWRFVNNQTLLLPLTCFYCLKESSYFELLIRSFWVIYLHFYYISCHISFVAHGKLVILLLCICIFMFQNHWVWLFEFEQNMLVQTFFGIVHKATKKKKPCFTGGRTCQVGSVGRAIFFLLLFMVPKNDPQNTKSSKKLWNFLQKNFGKTFRHIFKKFQPKFSDLGQKTADFTRFWKNTKNNNFLPKRKFGLVTPVKQGFLFLWPNQDLPFPGKTPNPIICIVWNFNPKQDFFLNTFGGTEEL